MNSIKLNNLNQGQLSKEQMNAVAGGESVTCSCGCCYANNGGSSVSDNLNANISGGLATKCDPIITITYDK
ncbi:MAG TPA: rSAM-modified peptide [Bacteroidales bacterium]|nr:rSAM-modified peptide [Bacteroidales bacterium]HBZ65831.1 rSAM-modified peptide [Bacteroidales bacterium]